MEISKGIVSPYAHRWLVESAPQAHGKEVQDELLNDNYSGRSH